ncbi:MAG: pyridoxal phosphate-dependent aminotransferase [Clostridium sp.]
MQKYVELLREPMQVKPESLRAARQKSSSTPPHVYRLNYNESPYGLGPASQAALEEAIKTPYVYPDWFSVELKTNLAELYGLKFENIAVGPGSSAMINMLGELFINPGDEFVFGDPSYEAFRDVANDYGAVPVAVPLDDDMNYDLDAMLAAITDKTKILVVVNPNNPTGTFIDSAKLEAFIRKVPKHVITVIDEAYMEFVDDPNSYSMMKLIKEEIDQPLIIMRTFSKIYGMAGLRVGYVITSPDMTDHFGKSSNAWNVSFIGQKTAAAIRRTGAFMVHDINANHSTSLHYAVNNSE